MVGPLGTGNASAGAPLPWALQEKSPPSLLPGRGETGSKRYLGVAQHRGMQILHFQHPQLVPVSFSLTQKQLQAQRLTRCWQQPSCAPVAGFGLPKTIQHQSRSFVTPLCLWGLLDPIPVPTFLIGAAARTRAPCLQSRSCFTPI